jgi:hypothetical protein
MNALLPSLSGLLTVDPFASSQTDTARYVNSPADAEPDASEPAVFECCISEEEMSELLKEFAKHGEKLDKRLTEEEEIRCFARFFSAIRQALMTVGTFSEGGAEDDEPDFISWSHDDPARIMRVTARVPVTLQTAQVVLAACEALGSEHAVVFDGKEGRCVVFSNGDFCREE